METTLDVTQPHLTEGLPIASVRRLYQRLAEQAPDLARQFREAKPYPHVVLDDFLPEEVAELVLANFPAPGEDLWTRMPTADQERKLASGPESRLPESARWLIHELNSGTFLDVLEAVTGVGHLVADTKLVAGGLHQIERGGKLSVHVDYSHHPGTNLCRRLNLIVYLNRDWREEYGGHFELWDKDMTRCEKRVAPLWNRAVIFSTTSTSYHGHPEPLTCPEGMTRKSLALYYYSQGRPEEPGPVVRHGTLFRSRPGEKTPLGARLLRLASSGLVQDLMPPLLYRWVRRAWHRRLSKK
jgi:hypothetical protein